MSPPPRSALAREALLICRRRRLTRREFAQLMLNQRGRCATCSDRLEPDAIVDEHLVPLDQGGSNALDNRALLCRRCARRKTRRDLKASAHGKRVRGETGQARRRELRAKGLLPPSFPTDRPTAWKKRLDGETIPRERVSAVSEPIESDAPTSAFSERGPTCRDHETRNQILHEEHDQATHCPTCGRPQRGAKP